MAAGLPPTPGHIPLPTPSSSLLLWGLPTPAGTPSPRLQGRCPRPRLRTGGDLSPLPPRFPAGSHRRYCAHSRLILRRSPPRPAAGLTARAGPPPPRRRRCCCRCRLRPPPPSSRAGPAAAGEGRQEGRGGGVPALRSGRAEAARAPPVPAAPAPATSAAPTGPGSCRRLLARPPAAPLRRPDPPAAPAALPGPAPPPPALPSAPPANPSPAPSPRRPAAEAADWLARCHSNRGGSGASSRQPRRLPACQGRGRAWAWACSRGAKRPRPPQGPRNDTSFYQSPLHGARGGERVGLPRGARGQWQQPRSFLTENVLTGTTLVGLVFPHKPGCPFPACLPAHTQGFPGFGCSGVCPRKSPQSDQNSPHLRFPPFPKTAGSTSPSAWEAASSSSWVALHQGRSPQPQSQHCSQQVLAWSWDTLRLSMVVYHIQIFTLFTLRCAASCASLVTCFILKLLFFFL